MTRVVQTCRTCRFLHLPANKAGHLYAASGKTHPCLVPLPEPILPASVHAAYDWRWPPGKSQMGPDDGADCELWQARP